MSKSFKIVSAQIVPK